MDGQTDITATVRVLLWRSVTGVDKKFPEFLNNIYLRYSHKSASLVTFKVIPLWLDATIPAQLPLLVTLSKICKGNAVKGRQRSSLNLCNVSKTPPFSNHDSSLRTKESLKERGQTCGGWDITHQFVFSQKRDVFLTLQGFHENRWRVLTAFPLKILDDVSSSGSGFAIAASSHTGALWRWLKFQIGTNV
jgi:hypothetical protein